MSESMYCPKCNSYLMAGDGKCHDCTCGWTQSRDSENDEYWSAEVSALEDNVSQLQSHNRQLSDLVSGLEAERDELRAQVEAMRPILRECRIMTLVINSGQSAVLRGMIDATMGRGDFA